MNKDQGKVKVRVKNRNKNDGQAKLGKFRLVFSPMPFQILSLCFVGLSFSTHAGTEGPAPMSEVIAAEALNPNVRNELEFYGPLVIETLSLDSLEKQKKSKSKVLDLGDWQLPLKKILVDDEEYSLPNDPELFQMDEKSHPFLYYGTKGEKGDGAIKLAQNLFENGRYKKKPDNIDLEKHQDSLKKYDSSFVQTTKSLDIAKKFAGNNSHKKVATNDGSGGDKLVALERMVFVLDAGKQPVIDIEKVRKFLRLGRSKYASEQEVLLYRYLPPASVTGVFLPDRVGANCGPNFYLNPLSPSAGKMLSFLKELTVKKEKTFLDIFKDIFQEVFETQEVQSIYIFVYAKTLYLVQSISLLLALIRSIILGA